MDSKECRKKKLLLHVESILYFQQKELKWLLEEQVHKDLAEIQHTLLVRQILKCSFVNFWL